MRLGLVGYGMGGRFFHAPFAAAAHDVELVGVVTRSAERRAELAADFPGVPVHDTLADLLAAGVDAVTITTPPQTRRALVLEALAAGVPTIADKPFAPDARGGRELVAAAEEAGVALNVFHNRRWDADIRTLAVVLQGGELGELWGVESRMDLDNADTLEIGPDAGLLRDLGSHLVDQMLMLLGPARTVYAELDHVEPPGGRTDCAVRGRAARRRPLPGARRGGRAHPRGSRRRANERRREPGREPTAGLTSRSGAAVTSPRGERSNCARPPAGRAASRRGSGSTGRRAGVAARCR